MTCLRMAAAGLLALAITGAQAGTFPKRIISMSPHYTSILYDLGAQDLLVGVTNFCRYPPEARKKESVGGFLDPNLEKVVQLRPDLVLMLPAHGARIAALKNRGIRVLVMGNDRLSDVWKAYDEVGRALGMEKEARAARGRLQGRLEKMKEAARGRKPLTGLFVAGKDPGVVSNIYAAGPGTFPDELMTMAGIRNVMVGSKVKYPLVSREVLIHLDPDLIFQAPPEGSRAKVLAARELQSWRKWRALKAVRYGRVHVIPDPGVLVPGPGLAGLAVYLDAKASEAARP